VVLIFTRSSKCRFEQVDPTESIHRSAIVNTKLPSLKALSLAALLCAASAAHADITIYTNQSAFLAAVSAPGVDTYDDLEIQLYDPTLNRSAGSYSYTATAPLGLFGAGSGADRWLSNNARTDSITFADFSSGVSAFGGNFFASDAAGQFVFGNMVLTASDGSSLVYALNNADTNSFVGFVSTSPLSSVTLATDGGVYWPTANNVTLAMAVPEPSSWGMLLGGMGLLGFLSRRSGGKGRG
jgi:hypothetical protein